MTIFDKLDNYYESKKVSEVWLMVILLAAVIGYLLYTVFEPMSSNYLKREQTLNNDLKNKISKATDYLNSITVNGDKNFKIKELDKKIETNRENLNQYRQKVAKIDGAVSKLSSVLYNKDNWSRFLHDISNRAKDNNLKVYNITNNKLEQNSTFGKVLEVNIVAQGEYGNILSFMNDLEQTDLVTDISNVNIEASDTQPKVDINLSVWGIRQ